MIRAELQKTTQEKVPTQQSSKGQRGEQSMLAEFSRDLTQSAMDQPARSAGRPRQ